MTARFVEESLSVQTIIIKFAEFSGALRITIEQNTPSFQMRGPGIQKFYTSENEKDSYCDNLGYFLFLYVFWPAETVITNKSRSSKD